MENDDTITISVQNDDGEEVETTIAECFCEQGIAFRQIVSGQCSECSCILYIDGLCSADRERALRVIENVFIVLDRLFDPDQERTSQPLGTERRRDHSWTIGRQFGERFLSRNRITGTFPFDQWNGTPTDRN